jgi:hypothetical protein
MWFFADMKQPIQWGKSVFENMILDAIFRQVGAFDPTSQMALFKRVAASSFPTAPDCLPTSRQEWIELSVLANNGPAETECYYAWAAAVLESRKLMHQRPRMPRCLASRAPLRRMQRINESLKAGKFPNCQQLAQEFEMCPKTIQRDFDFMRDSLNLPIQYDPKRAGFYYDPEPKATSVFPVGIASDRA